MVSGLRLARGSEKASALEWKLELVLQWVSVSGLLWELEWALGSLRLVDCACPVKPQPLRDPRRRYPLHKVPSTERLFANRYTLDQSTVVAVKGAG